MDHGVVDGAHTTRERKRKRKKTAGSGYHHIPGDVLINSILCRLPLPCLFRCTAVCKAWRSLVHDAYALHGGTALMPNFGLGILTYNISHGPGIRIIIPPSPHGCEKNNIIKVIRRQYPQNWLYSDSSNGFLLYRSSSFIKGSRWGYTVHLHVCNPLTYKSVPLPPLRSFSVPLSNFCMLVFDPKVSHHYKVLSFFGSYLKEDGENLFEKVCVFSSEEGRLGWRRLEVGLQAPPNVVSLSTETGDKTVCVNGYAYRLGFHMGPEYERAFNGVVLSFHIKEERFELIDSPPSMDYVMNRVQRGLDKAEDCLQYIYNDAAKISIWRLQEDDHRWALRHTICLNYRNPCPTGRANAPGSCALAFHRNEEVIFFIGVHGLLFRCYIKQQKIELYTGDDVGVVQGDDVSIVQGWPESLRPFFCCTVDPEFRRYGLRPPKCDVL